MSDGFEAYWALQGARYSTGDHKERARHAYEAGARSAAPTDSGRAEWLNVIVEKAHEMGEFGRALEMGERGRMARNRDTSGERTIQDARGRGG